MYRAVNEMGFCAQLADAIVSAQLATAIVYPSSSPCVHVILLIKLRTL